MYIYEVIKYYWSRSYMGKSVSVSGGVYMYCLYLLYYFPCVHDSIGDTDYHNMLYRVQSVFD